jgi:hypothetical protein
MARTSLGQLSREGVVVRFTTREGNTSSQEMATLTGRMAEVTERALAAGKQVTARVEVEAK